MRATNFIKINKIISFSETDKLQYAYDVNGIRKKKVVHGVTTEFTTNGSQILSMKRGDTTFTFRYVLNKLVGFHYNDHVVSKEYLYQRNIQGDILGIYDDEGNQVGEYAYDGYGNPVIVKDEGGIASLNPFRYRGYFYDEETGFYDLNARYYDPETGRFISPDTLLILDETRGQINGLNLYMYCADNPIMNVDPSGCVWWNPFTWNWDKIIKGIGQILMGISAIATSIFTFPFGGWIAVVAGITFFAGAGMILFGLSNTGEGISNYNLIKDGIFEGNEHTYSLTEKIFAITAYIGSLICGIYGFTHTKINYERSTPRVSNPHSASYNYRFNVLTYYGKNSEMRYSIGFFERNHQWIHWHTEMPHSDSINNFFKFIWEIIKKGF